MAKIGRFRITPELLVDILLLPDGTVATKAAITEHGDVEVTVESPTLPEIDGHEIPLVRPQYSVHEGRQPIFIGWERF